MSVAKCVVEHGVDLALQSSMFNPCSTTPLATDKNGTFHSETWEYASAVGMLMYLAGNAHPEITFAVHQCAHFTHSPRQSHSEAVKRIAC